ncbi:MAG TPA: small multi-drug export protein [Methanoregulaceae archaeon]|nr:small multi-drug export protein [Methanoregulaceae archaeon]
MRFFDLEDHFAQNKKFTFIQVIARFILPVVLAFAYYSGCILILPLDKALILGGLMIAYFIPPAGKESIIPLGIVLGIPWWLMASSLALLDILTALFMILNFGIVLRIPMLGTWISRFLESGNGFMARRPWLSRWGVLGVAFFVWLPLQGTGGMGAVLVGKMVGLTSRQILLAVGLGATAECLMFGVGFELIWRLLLTNLFLGLGVALSIIAFATLLYFLFKKRNMSGY